MIISPNGGRRTVTVGVDSAPRSLADNLTDVVQCLSYLVSIVLAAAFVMLRPSRVTWSFYAFVLLSLGLSVTPVTFGFLVIGAVTATLGFLTNVSWIPLAIFALRFPHDAPGKVARRLERALLASLVVCFALALYLVLGFIFAAVDPIWHPRAARIVRSLPTFGLVFTAAMFVLSYRTAIPSDRTRMRWVIAGFLAGYLGLVGHGILVVTALDFGGTLWLNNLLAAAPVFGPIAVTYAIVRHRVLDIRIVVRRAGVYALLTTTVVVLIAVMDFFLNKVFEGTKIAAIGEVGVAVILGLTLNPLHRRLETAVDAAIFRRRRHGRARLERIAAGLLHARSQQTISELIANEPVRAFDLTSAAIFERDAVGDFRRVSSAAWQAYDCAVLRHDAALVLQLIAADAPLRRSPDDLADLAGMPSDLRMPSLAVPITFRGMLDGFALYGAHRSGEQIDDEERAALVRLCRSAASAYDHLDAEAMRAHMISLEAEVARLRVVNA